MKILKFIIILGLSGISISSNFPVKFPQVEISNGLIDARLYLPDPQNGYYQGSRFDWSGIIPDLEYKGHTFFGKWFQKYDPKIHDAIMGPVNDFSPVGFSEAKAGGNFLKIGIGVLVKPDESKYSFSAPYKIVNHGKWEIKKKSNQIDFFHKLDHKDYSYEYKKIVRLTKNKPEMVLEHFLKNTGNTTIETSVYNHNFLMIDEQPVGPGYIIKFPFDVTGKIRETDDGLAKIDDKKIIFQKDFAQDDHVYYGDLSGFDDNPKDHQIWIENRISGAGVEITSDRPLSKLVFWSASTTVCPEPYIDIEVEPGETFKWQIFYYFYTLYK